MKSIYKKYINDEITLNTKTKIAIFCYIIVFAGVFGWIYEFIFYFFNSGMEHFYYRGANFLPWINIYATGSIIIYLLTYKLKKHPFFIFLISSLATGILEYIAGYGMYKLDNGIRCWDYRNEILSFGNIDGFVCLRSVLIFGLSALLLMYVIIPIFIYLSTKIRKKVFLYMGIVIFSIFIIDELYNLVFANILGTPRAREIYEKNGILYMDYYKNNE